MRGQWLNARTLRWVFVVATLASACNPAPVVPAYRLEVVGVDGNRTLLSWDALTGTDAVEGVGGILNTAGRITSPTRYKGVLLEDLAAFGGGLKADSGLRVVASDDFVVTLSSSQVLRGDVVTFDAESGLPTTVSEPLRAVLAYEREGEFISEQDGGPLRVAFLTGSESQVTEGHLWVKNVVRLELVPMDVDWTLRLEGARTEEISRTLFESGAAPGCHEARWDDVDGRAWSGIPLWLLVGWVDDDNLHRPGAFNRELATAGYEIELVSSSGERQALESDRVSLDDGIIVAYLVDDEPLDSAQAPLRLVGSSLAPEEMLDQIEEIVVHVP